ncbi:MAG: glycosyltransferase [Candidatus Omnitrophica bacterium]|nr:glycosyltransferase [Candidatus Omnitrophota bacterium]
MDYDVVFIHREACPVGPIFFEWIARRLGKKIIFDFDDAIYLPNVSRANSVIKVLKNQNKVKKIIRLSSVVIAGNSHLKKYASNYNRNVVVIPTAIDTEKYSAIKKIQPQNEPLCIGWSGSYTTVQHLLMLKEVLRKIYNRYKISIKIIGSAPNFKMGDIPLTVAEWSMETELEELVGLDIGFMPLPDDEWGRGKCGLKALQYMALGIPAVCSPVGVNQEIIEDGINGFFASSEAEWVEKISRLIENPELRRSIGCAGKKTVEERYSVKANFPKFFNAIQANMKCDI